MGLARPKPHGHDRPPPAALACRRPAATQLLVAQPTPHPTPHPTPCCAQTLKLLASPAGKKFAKQERAAHKVANKKTSGRSAEEEDLVEFYEALDNAPVTRKRGSLCAAASRKPAAQRSDDEVAIQTCMCGTNATAKPEDIEDEEPWLHCAAVIAEVGGADGAGRQRDRRRRGADGPRPGRGGGGGLGCKQVPLAAGNADGVPQQQGTGGRDCPPAAGGEGRGCTHGCQPLSRSRRWQELPSRPPSAPPSPPTPSPGRRSWNSRPQKSPHLRNRIRRIPTTTPLTETRRRAGSWRQITRTARRRAAVLTMAAPSAVCWWQ